MDTLGLVTLPLPISSSELNGREHLWTSYLALLGIIYCATTQQWHRRSNLALYAQWWSDKGIVGSQSSDCQRGQGNGNWWWSWRLGQLGKIPTYTAQTIQWNSFRMIHNKNTINKDKVKFMKYNNYININRNSVNNLNSVIYHSKPIPLLFPLL